MKKRKTTAILIASTLMLSIVGCSGASAASGSSEMEMTEAELREAAREAMIATEDSSAAASSGDTSASASSEASAAASSSDAATTANSAAEVTTTLASVPNPDAATTASSATATAANVTATNATPAPAANNATPAPAPAANNTTPAANTTQNAGSLAEYEIMLNGKKVSILDDAATVQANLGKLEEKDTTWAGSAEEPRYVYSSNNIIFYTFVDNGNELTYDLCVSEKGAKTSRGVGVGDSKDAIVAAYGNPVETYEYYQGFGMKYKFDKFTLYFDFDSNTNKVIDVAFGNNDTITKRHAKHPDYIGD